MAVIQHWDFKCAFTMYHRFLTQIASVESSKTFITSSYTLALPRGKVITSKSVVFQTFGKLPSMQVGKLVPFPQLYT